MFGVCTQFACFYTEFSVHVLWGQFLQIYIMGIHQNAVKKCTGLYTLEPKTPPDIIYSLFTNTYGQTMYVQIS